ncbi:cuticle protein 14-like [Rhipicephalus sanguineus]|uniref:cuticle protein 14-like n=1 Tax=Rhipicephalus sanguineus TaxID=34632 RepID=UPI001894D9E4|nr:cuticle protein 14-like [Rhipicephalus sanguineus]
MKEYIVLPVLLAVARAGYVAPVTGYIETESSTSHHSQDVAGNYNFGYKERHPGGATFRQETGNPWGHKVGSYGIADADGRVRLVKYVADTNGFRVYISTNEPGTAASSPAGAGINAPVALPTAPAVEPLLLEPSTAVGVVAKAIPAVTAAHVYGPPIVGPVLKPAAPVAAALGGLRPAYAKKSYVAAAVQPGLEVEYDARDDRHW